jgi:hypothetical protein
MRKLVFLDSGFLAHKVQGSDAWYWSTNVIFIFYVNWALKSPGGHELAIAVTSSGHIGLLCPLPDTGNHCRIL